MHIKVEAKGLEELRGKLSDPELLRKPVRDMMFKARGIARKEAKTRIDGGTGIAVRSIQSRVRPAEAEVWSMIADDRARSIEEGRKVGEVVPYMAAARWLTGRTRSFTPTQDEHKASLAVIDAIRASGTKGKKFIAGAYEAVQERMPELMAAVVEKVKGGLRR